MIWTVEINLRINKIWKIMDNMIIKFFSNLNFNWELIFFSLADQRLEHELIFIRIVLEQERRIESRLLLSSYKQRYQTIVCRAMQLPVKVFILVQRVRVANRHELYLVAQKFATLLQDLLGQLFSVFDLAKFGALVGHAELTIRAEYFVFVQSLVSQLEKLEHATLIETICLKIGLFQVTV